MTIGTTTHPLEAPFLVMATQNPIEMEGTYPLPEAQLDRFLMKILVQVPFAQRPEHYRRAHHSKGRRSSSKTFSIATRFSVCATFATPFWSRRTCRSYAIDLVMATQPGTDQAHEMARKFIRYGSSPRGAQALVECGRVLALMKGRLHLSTEDIQAVAPAVLRHRIIFNFDAHAEGQTPETILSSIIPSVGAAAHR